MRITFWKLLAPLPLLLLSCSDHTQEDAHREAKTIRVTVGSGPRIDIQSEAATRSEIGPDGEAVKWNTDDRIALWAENTEDGTFALAAHEFALYHYNATWNAAKFTADIPQMEAGTYNYYAVSPVPAAVEGTLASFDIPAVQDGEARIESLVMVADPVAAQDALTQGDNSDRVSLHFTHKVHVLKIAIPSNALDEPVSELQLTFPEPVVGRLTVDAADPATEGVLTEGTNTLTLRFAEPKNVGDVVFAAIRPMDIPAEQPIEIRALGQTCESKAAFFAGKEFRAGHTTPLVYNVPAAGRYFTRLRFSLPKGKGVNTLGEEVTRIKLTAPAGATFGNNSNTLEFRPDADGTHTIMLRPSWEDRLSGSKVTVEYESESAVVSNTVTMPAITEWEENKLKTFEVPYLFEEDFSATTTYNNNGGLSNSGHDGATVWGDGFGLKGWSGNQYYVEGGKALTIRHQTEKWGLLGTYRGRVDSAPIAGIKKTVKVSVSFNYNGRTNESRNTPVLNYGWTTNQNALSGYYEGGSSAVKGGEKIETQAGSVTAPTDGSFDKIDRAISFTIDNCTNRHRLSWDCYVSANRNFNTNQQWVFIDNVKVSIAK